MLPAKLGIHVQGELSSLVDDCRSHLPLMIPDEWTLQGTIRNEPYH